MRKKFDFICDRTSLLQYKNGNRLCPVSVMFMGPMFLLTKNNTFMCHVELY